MQTPPAPPSAASPIVSAVFPLLALVVAVVHVFLGSPAFAPSVPTSQKVGALLSAEQAERKMRPWLGLSWILGVLFLLLLLFLNKNRSKNLPPGPSGWLALRNLWSLKEFSMLQMLLKVSFGTVLHSPGKRGPCQVRVKAGGNERLFFFLKFYFHYNKNKLTVQICKSIEKPTETKQTRNSEYIKEAWSNTSKFLASSTKY